MQNDGSFTVRSKQDISRLIKYNTDARNNNIKGFTKSKDLRYIAEVPLIVFEHWRKHDGFDYLNKKVAVLFSPAGRPIKWERVSKQEATQWLRRKLHEYKQFRTSEGGL